MKEIMFITLTTLIFVGCEKEKTKELLFVCTGGSEGTPIAALHFNRLAKENNLDYHAVFRDLNADTDLDPEVYKGLIRDGFDVSYLKTEKLSKEDIDKAYKVIKFDCSLPFVSLEHRTVNRYGVHTVVDNYDRARDILKVRVEELIKKLMESN